MSYVNFQYTECSGAVNNFVNHEGNNWHKLLSKEQIDAMIPREYILSSRLAEEVGIWDNAVLGNADIKLLRNRIKTTNLNIEESAINDLAAFIILHKEGMVACAKRRNASIFYPKEATGCPLSFDVTPEGRVLLHLRQKSVSSIKVTGGFKMGKLSLDLYGNQLCLTQTVYITVRAVRSIRNELDKISDFKRLKLEHFVPVISCCCYKAKNPYLGPGEFEDYKYSVTTPYYPLGDLSKYLNVENINLDKLIHNIAIAVKELHDQGYLHLDLKPENVLLKDKSNCEISLCDFGNVRELNLLSDLDLNLYFAPPEWMNAVIGTPTKHQTALEQMDQGKRYDSYSFGLLIYLLKEKKKESELPWGENVTKYAEFQAEGEVQLMKAEYQKIICKKMKFFRKAKNVLGPLSKLLHEDPSVRMSIEKVVELSSQN